MEIFTSKNLYINFLIASIFFIPISALDPYSEALLSLKSELIINKNSDSLKNWATPSRNAPHSNATIYACSWSGITCNNNGTIVIGLDLSGNNLLGEIPGKHLRVFRDLVALNMSQNSFYGHLPTDIFNLTNLRTLDISRNNFSGPFPYGVSRLSGLVVLDVFSNNFDGSLPIDVSNISSLKVLNLAGSYFNGGIPVNYGGFKALEFLHLAGNVLSGEIPVELGKLKTVKHMELGYNSYHGNIPWQLGNMSELQYLDISGANLSGSIPVSFCNLTKLESLFMFRNQLSGAIPVGISKIMSLTDLDLSDNRISGKIPEEFFSELKSLRLLSLMFNEMSGTVPEGIDELPMLDTLFLWNNYFSGNLPKNLGKNSKLKWLDVSSNSFNGSIPSSLCTGGMLFKLILFSNNFTGVLSALSNCSSLVRVRIEDNSFSGEIPFKFTKFLFLQYLDMSKNNFSGEIPLDIDQAIKLEYFSIFNNHLTGSIPEELASLPDLSVLDLSNNNFSGSIPEKFVESSILRLLNVSYNNISGSIPSNGVFKLMDSSAFVGNPNLCGAPLHACPERRDRTSKLTLTGLICLGVVLFVLVSMLGMYYYQRGYKRQWEMVSYTGLPRFTANDVLKSINSSTGCIAVLPTGITVTIKKIEWESKNMEIMMNFISQLGNARHKNLTRLLGFCYSTNEAYLLYDYLPKGNMVDKIRMKMDWEEKYKIMAGIARGLCYLHHDSSPAIAHGDLKLCNIMFDENMEPYLAEFGFKFLIQLNKGELNTAYEEELYKDIHHFGEVIVEILTSGRVKNVGESIQSKQREALLREIYKENDVRSNKSSQEEMKVVLDVALLCTKSRPSDRPSMEEVLKLLS